MMTLSESGLSLIKSFEALRLKAYRDVAGVWTIGYGSTRYHDGKVVKPGDVLANELQASALLKNTIAEYENGVTRLVKVKLNQNQFDALVSFTYNVGVAALAKSSALQLLNEGDYVNAAQHLLIWDKAKDPQTGEKVTVPALAVRRKKESELFLKAA